MRRRSITGRNLGNLSLISLFVSLDLIRVVDIKIGSSFFLNLGLVPLKSATVFGIRLLPILGKIPLIPRTNISYFLVESGPICKLFFFKFQFFPFHFFFQSTLYRVLRKHFIGFVNALMTPVYLFIFVQF